MEAFIVSVVQKYLYAGVFLLLLACGLGVPMPEDVILVTGGYVSYLYPNNVNLWTLLLVSMAGVLVGDSIIFMAGRHFGPRVMTLWPFRKVLTPARLSKMEGYFRTYGNKIIFAGRFLAGLRAPLFMTAGVSRHPYWKFIVFDGIAALISVPVWVLGAHYFGEEIDRLKHMLIRTQKALIIIIPLVIAVWFLYRRFTRKREEDIDPWNKKGGGRW